MRLPTDAEWETKSAAAVQLDLHRGDVKSREAFLLEFAVIDPGAGAGDDFGDGVGEIDALAGAAVAFDDGCLRRRLENDQHARVGDGRLFAGR